MSVNRGGTPTCPSGSLADGREKPKQGPDPEPGLRVDRLRFDGGWPDRLEGGAGDPRYITTEGSSRGGASK